MGFAQDAKAQWDKLPTAGKVALGGGVLVILILFVYKRQPGGGSTQQLEPTTNPSSMPPSSAFPGVQSGGNSVPYLPTGINPLYDQQGGLIAFQQQAAGNPSNGGSVSPPPSPAANPLAYLGLLGANAHVNFQNRTYVDSSGKSVPIPIDQNAKLVQGSDNRVWYTDTGGQHLLTSGSGPAINPTTNKPFAGGGGQSYQSYARGLREYTIRYGENLHATANQLRIKGGLSAWLAHNNYPSDFFHGMVLQVPS